MKTLKYIIAFAAIILTSGAVTAQNDCLTNNPDNRTYIGVRAAVDISSAANGNSYYSNNAGFHFGAIYNIPLWHNLYFEPGLSLFYNVFGTRSESIVEITMPGTDSPADSRYLEANGSIRNLGFRIPLTFGYHFDFAEDLSVCLFTGPEMNINLLARYHNNEARVWAESIDGATYNYELLGYVENHSVFGTGGFKHLDFGWRFGAGVTYQSYYLSLSGSLGMTRLKDHTAYLPQNIRRNIFSLTLGYNF